MLTPHAQSSVPFRAPQASGFTLTLDAHLHIHLSARTRAPAQWRAVFAPVACRSRTFSLSTTSLLRAHALSSRYIRPVGDADLHHSLAEALHTRSLSHILLCHTTSHLLLSTTLKRPCSLPPPLRFRTLPRPMVCARVRSHQPAEQSGLLRSGYGEHERRGSDSLFANHTLRASKRGSGRHPGSERG